ncbi:MAG: DUF1501 domain-containing protein [Planctomycetota bacterium]|nr:DUF1501 domain-containing protein [Planctomycetota bacterium]
MLAVTKPSRRTVLKMCLGSAFGLSLTEILRANPNAPAKSVIHLNLSGGFSAQESWDPKPEAPIDYRGSFGVVKTGNGYHFSENFPRMARISDKITVVRSMHCKIPDHGQATYHLFTGYLPTTVIDYPQMGSVVAHEYGIQNNMPPYIAIPNRNSFAGGTGYLSSKFGVFELNADPGGRGEFKVKDLSIPGGVSARQFERRTKARALLENSLQTRKVDASQLGTMGQFYEQAYTLLNSEAAQKAFTLEGESDATKELYGQGYILNYRRQPAAVGARLLMARRLVAAGVRFVSVDYGGWDNHKSIRDAYLDKGPALDHAIAGLISDLDQRGMLDETLVMVTTEFGRTPRVNTANGRDHWARSYSMMLAGGGITRGQIYGASDATANEPDKNPVSLEDFLCTVYHQLGIDSNKELLAFGTRPIEIVKGGKVVKGLLA